MHRFSRLYEELDRTTSTNRKVQAIAGYLADVPAKDAAWAIFFLTGQRLKRLISGRLLRLWVLSETGLPEWLVDESHAAVGDSAETVALLLDREPRSTSRQNLPLSSWLEDRILLLRDQPLAQQQAAVATWWHELSAAEIFLLNKLLTGSFRVGVSKLLVVRALAAMTGLPRAVVSHRLMGRWQPTADWYRRLIAEADDDVDISRPYPFFLASPLEQEPADLGLIDDWLVEWKWDGIRGQLIRRGNQTFIWTRGEELVTERYPELVAAAAALPDGLVIDGEILAWDDEGVLPFAVLQKRIGRDKLSPRILKEAPVAFLAYDLLEDEGLDIRNLPLEERRCRLEAVISTNRRLELSPLLKAANWDDLKKARLEARSRRVEGLMLKRRGSPYRTGRQRGDWWKWKIDPLSIDAVLIYAQAGSGRRANLFTDYTFAVWKGVELVPVAKAYSGLSDEEIAKLDRWVRQHTTERFGPVRQVEPLLVFELAFEGINASSRHKSGVALRFPRISRWRTDKTPKDADTLEQVHGLLQLAG